MLAINEAKYDLYHKDFSSAMQHAYKMAKKLHGITVDSKEIDDKVASGPRKPSEGKTNKYRLKGDKGAIQVQVYNKGGPKPFELNMYKEEVELDEASKLPPHLAKFFDKDGNLKKDAADRIAKGKQKLNIKDVTPKGYGPKEEVELDEGKINPAQIAQLKKAFEPMRGKKISMKNGEKLRTILDKVADDKEALLALLKANIPFVSRGAATRLISKHDMKGAEINKLMAAYNMEEVELDENLQRAKKLMGPSKNKEQGIELVMKGLKISKQKATQMVDKILDEEVELEEQDDDRVAKAQARLDKAKKVAGLQKQISDVKKEELDKKDEPKIKGIIKKLKGASQAHAGQAKDLEKAVKEEDFKPHMMYDPKTGKAYKAEKEEDHLRMKKMGYVHEKPKVKSEVYELTKKIQAEAYQLDEKIAGLVKKADKSGMPYGILKKVYDRGMAAWKTGHRPGTTPQQWAFARVNSFITKGSGTWGKADKDLASQVREVLELDNENEIDESLWANIAAKRKRIKAGSGEKMRKPGEKGAPTPAQMAKAKNESAASDARRAMAADPSTKQKFSKNVSATDDDVKSADKNIMMQMRKAVSLRGNKVEFMDKKKVMIPQKIAQTVIAKYNSMRKPADKEKFQSKISKSYKSMLTALKEQNEINNQNNSLHELKSLVREMKGKDNG